MSKKLFCLTALLGLAFTPGIDGLLRISFPKMCKCIDYKTANHCYACGWEPHSEASAVTSRFELISITH